MNIQTMTFNYDTCVAAVQNGADEVLFAPSFPREQIEQTLKYCRLRGIFTVLDLTGSFKESMLTSAAQRLSAFCSCGLDAVSFSDFGILRVAKMICPTLEYHYNGGVEHNAAVIFAKQAGCHRAVISSEISREDFYSTCKHSGIALQIQAIGPICPAKQGYDCLLGGKNNSLHDGCQKMCRKAYGSDNYPLFYKDGNLLSHIETFKVNKLRALTVCPPNDATAAALLTQLASSALSGHVPGEKEMNIVSNALQTGGFTDSFFSEYGKGLLTEPHSTPQGTSAKRLLDMARDSYTVQPERGRVAVRFMAQISQNERAKLAVDDYNGNTVYVTGPIPANSDTPILEAELNTQWHKTTGTPFFCKEARSVVSGNITMSVSDLGDMRRDVLKKLSDERIKKLSRNVHPYRPSIHLLPRRDKPLLTIRLSSFRQLTPELLAIAPHLVYVPLEEVADNQEKVLQILEKGIIAAAALPRRISDSQTAKLKQNLEIADVLGIKQVLINHPTHYPLVRDFIVRGDSFISNSQSLKFHKHLGLASACLSPALNMTDIKSISDNLDTELIGYGRIPVLLSDSCIIKRANQICNCENTNTLTDEAGNLMPLVRESVHRTQILHGQKIWLADDLKKFLRIGIWALRLNFTTENAIECVQVAEKYTGTGKYSPNQKTTGFYFDGIKER